MNAIDIILLKVFERMQKVCAKHNISSDARPLLNSVAKTAILGGSILGGNCFIEEDVRVSGSAQIGAYTKIGMRNIIYGNDIVVGRYCQFAPYVALYSVNHSISTITTYNGRSLFAGRLKSLSSELPVRIGNDVWLGHGVVVLPGAEVGDCSIVGAGSIVTSKYEPFSVIAGNPARIIRKRFDDSTRTLIMKLRWWERTPEELSNLETLFSVKAEPSPQVLMEALKLVLNERV